MTANTPARAFASMEFTADAKARKATSACGCYWITWADGPHGRYFNAWFGDSPRKHLTGTFDKELAKTVCEQHSRKLSQAA